MELRERAQQRRKTLAVKESTYDEFRAIYDELKAVYGDTHIVSQDEVLRELIRAYKQFAGVKV